MFRVRGKSCMKMFESGRNGRRVMCAPDECWWQVIRPIFDSSFDRRTNTKKKRKDKIMNEYMKNIKKLSEKIGDILGCCEKITIGH